MKTPFPFRIALGPHDAPQTYPLGTSPPRRLDSGGDAKPVDRGGQRYPRFTMPYELEDKLVVGITSRALVRLEGADQVFRAEGLGAYRAHQRKHENYPLEPGTAFPLVRGLLNINELTDDRLVEVIVMSRNDADSGVRVYAEEDPGFGAAILLRKLESRRD